MVNHKLQFICINTLATARKEIQSIGSAPESIDIMAPKAVFKIIKIEDIVLQDAIIIKQDMLSLGGEVAIPRNAFEVKKNPEAILIMGTISQLWRLVEKLQRHYSRIKEISADLAALLENVS